MAEAFIGMAVNVLLTDGTSINGQVSKVDPTTQRLRLQDVVIHLPDKKTVRSMSTFSVAATRIKDLHIVTTHPGEQQRRPVSPPSPPSPTPAKGLPRQIIPTSYSPAPSTSSSVSTLTAAAASTVVSLSHTIPRTMDRPPIHEQARALYHPQSQSQPLYQHQHQQHQQPHVAPQFSQAPQAHVPLAAPMPAQLPFYPHPSTVNAPTTPPSAAVSSNAMPFHDPAIISFALPDSVPKPIQQQQEVVAPEEMNVNDASIGTKGPKPRWTNLRKKQQKDHGNGGLGDSSQQELQTPSSVLEAPPLAHQQQQQHVSPKHLHPPLQRNHQEEIDSSTTVFESSATESANVGHNAALGRDGSQGRRNRRPDKRHRQQQREILQQARNAAVAEEPACGLEIKVGSADNVSPVVDPKRGDITPTESLLASLNRAPSSARASIVRSGSDQSPLYRKLTPAEIVQDQRPQRPSSSSAIHPRTSTPHRPVNLGHAAGHMVTRSAARKNARVIVASNDDDSVLEGDDEEDEVSESVADPYESEKEEKDDSTSSGDSDLELFTPSGNNLQVAPRRASASSASSRISQFDSGVPRRRSVATTTRSSSILEASPPPPPPISNANTKASKAMKAPALIPASLSKPMAKVTPDHSPRNPSVPSPTSSSTSSFADRPRIQTLSGFPCQTLTPEQMQKAEVLSASEYGLSALQRIENGGRGAAMMCLQALGGSRRIHTRNHNSAPVVVILAGNNTTGGYALAAARHLVNHGCQVLAFVMKGGAVSTGKGGSLRHGGGGRRKAEGGGSSSSLIPIVADQVSMFLAVTFESTGKSDGTGHHTALLTKLEELPDPLDSPVDLIVDGILGYEYAVQDLKELSARETVFELMDWANDNKAPVLSLDMPSGVNPAKEGRSDTRGQHCPLGVEEEEETGARRRGFGVLQHHPLHQQDLDEQPAVKTVKKKMDRTMFCVRPKWTLCLGVPKVGCRSRSITGELFVADVGIPRACWAKVLAGGSGGSGRRKSTTVMAKDAVGVVPWGAEFLLGLEYL